ncbi:MAG: DUF4180 domain-containing protein [Christensenellales bacterium]
MKIRVIQANGNPIAVVHNETAVITDGQTALDFLMNVQYETESSSIVLNKEALCEDFFVLSTRIAGDVLQKVVNYRFRLAIVGDFSQYTSKPLKDFIYESNNGNAIFFLPSESEAVEKLSKV